VVGGSGGLPPRIGVGAHPAEQVDGAGDGAAGVADAGDQRVAADRVDRSDSAGGRAVGRGPRLAGDVAATGICGALPGLAGDSGCGAGADANLTTGGVVDVLLLASGGARNWRGIGLGLKLAALWGGGGDAAGGGDRAAGAGVV